MIFHFSSPEPYEAHRTAASSIPFKKIVVTLSSGIVVSAEKEAPFDTKTYKLSMTRPGQAGDLIYIWERDKSGRDPETSDYTKYCEALSESGIRFHFLSDNRRVEGMSEESRQNLIRRHHLHHLHLSTAEREFSRYREIGEIPDTTEVLVNDAIERTLQWFQQQTLTGANAGYTSVNAIYTELLRRIVETDDSNNANTGQSASELQENLKDLNERNPQFSQYGLTPELDTEVLVSLLGKAKQNHAQILSTILQPYLDGHNARLDALQPVQNVINEFVTMLESFFSRKSIGLDVRNKMSILSNDHKELRPSMLSSGEKQLVLLLCNAITARNDGTIFIIDEPEISLNVKWQRRLIQALLTCLDGVESQLVMATHSIEILSQYKEFVVPLNDISGND